LVFEVGPIDLAVPKDPGAAVIWQFPPQLGTIPFDLTMHGYGVEVVDGDGKKLPQRQILHHIDTTRPAFRELFLPVAQRFIAAGGETDQKALRMPTWLGGLRLYRGEPFLVSAMLWNLTGAPHHGVRARLVMYYSHKKPLYDLYPLHLNVMFPVGVKSFDLPPGRSERSWEGSPVIRGGIVALGGHLHTYAEWIELFDVTANKRIWRIKPRKDESGEVTGVPVRQYRSGAAYPIFPNHRYRVKSVYVNPTDYTIVEGGMAVVGGAFIPKRGVAWPPARADDPLYHKDLEFMLRNHPCHVPAGEAAVDPDAGS